MFGLEVSAVGCGMDKGKVVIRNVDERLIRVLTPSGARNLAKLINRKADEVDEAYENLCEEMRLEKEKKEKSKKRRKVA